VSSLVTLGEEDHEVRLAAGAYVSQAWHYDMAAPRSDHAVDRLFGHRRCRITAADYAAAEERMRKDDWPLSAVAAHHHQHVWPSHIWEVTTAQRRAWAVCAVALMARWDDVSIATVGTIAAYAAVAPQRAVAVLLRAAAWDAPGPVQWARQLKYATQPLKALQNGLYSSLTELFEMEVLVNRGIGDVDWETERMHRTQPTVVPITEGEAREHARRAFMEGRSLGRGPRPMRWDDFWDDRWDWAPTGSFHSQYPEDLQYVAGKQGVLKTKFVALNRMPTRSLQSFTGRTPAIAAWESEKYEWGKRRAIYGTDITSFIVTSYAMFGCEQALPDRFPIGAAADERRVSKITEAMLRGRSPFCFDYEDFNSQHSYAAMRGVLKAYLDVYRGTMDAEQVEALSWVVSSVDNEYVVRPGGEDYQCNGTLFSGWRMTSFMNSVLNYVYLSWSGALDAAPDLQAIHNGDDVLATVTTPLSAAEFMYRTATHGIRASPVKCHSFCVAEFLRVDRWSGSSSGQYLSRAVSTLVHSRLESPLATDASALLRAAITRDGEARARGADGDTMTRLLDLLRRRMARRYGVEPDTLNKMEVAHQIVGGFSEAEDAPVDMKYMFEVSQAPMDEVRRELGRLPGAWDLAALLHRKYDLQVPISSMYEPIVKATVRALTFVLRRLVTEGVASSESMTIRRALWKTIGAGRDAPMMGKLKVAGINLSTQLSTHRNEMLAAHLKDCADPMRMLRERVY